MFFGLVMITAVLTTAPSWWALPLLQGPVWFAGVCVLFLLGSHAMSDVFMGRSNMEESEARGHFFYITAVLPLLGGFPRGEGALPAFALLAIVTPPAAGLLWLEPGQSENPLRRLAVWGFCGLSLTVVSCTSGNDAEIYFWGYPALLLNCWAFSLIIPALGGWKAPRLPGPRPMELAVELLESGPGHAPASPTEPSPAVSSRKPVLLAAGGFRLNKPRALEILKEHQMTIPHSFLLPWLRAAALGGAGRIEINPIWRGFRMKFDGAPLPPRSMEDPWSCLFEDSSPDAGRSRHLAYGLLALMRLAPAAVTIFSGEGRARRRMRLEQGSTGGRCREDDAPPGTVIAVRWRLGAAFLPRSLAFTAVQGGFGLSAARLFVNGREVPDLPIPEDFPCERFECGPVRGAVFPWSTPGHLTLSLYKLGAQGDSLDWPFQDLPAEACLADDGFTLTASQDGVVKNSVYNRALKALERELPARVKNLLVEVARRREAGVPVPAPWRMFEGRFRTRLPAGDWPPVGWRSGPLGIMVPDRALMEWERAARGERNPLGHSS